MDCLCLHLSVFESRKHCPGSSVGASSISPATPNPAIDRALLSIQPPHIEKTILSLVSFATFSNHFNMEEDPQRLGGCPLKGLQLDFPWQVSCDDIPTARLR